MTAPRNHERIEPESAEFFRRAMRIAEEQEIPFLVGGAYALEVYAGISRHTKDFDVFVRPSDLDRLLAAFRNAGCQSEIVFPHWLGKAYCGTDFVDVIFGSGNGIARVDEAWFEHAEPAEVLGVPVLLCPAEEMIWSKAFVQERERYDGADIAHLIRARGPVMDWPRLLRRMDPHWRVLLAHLVLFEFVYPGERLNVPRWVLRRLHERALQDDPADALAGQVCRGTLLSRSQYLVDVQDWGYLDARRGPRGTMTDAEIAIWTDAAETDADEAAAALALAKDPLPAQARWPAKSGSRQRTSPRRSRRRKRARIA
jgi:hypothetical protein